MAMNARVSMKLFVFYAIMLLVIENLTAGILISQPHITDIIEADRLWNDLGYGQSFIAKEEDNILGFNIYFGKISGTGNFFYRLSKFDNTQFYNGAFDLETENVLASGKISESSIPLVAQWSSLTLETPIHVSSNSLLFIELYRDKESTLLTKYGRTTWSDRNGLDYEDGELVGIYMGGRDRGSLDLAFEVLSSKGDITSNVSVTNSLTVVNIINENSTPNSGTPENITITETSSATQSLPTSSGSPPPSASFTNGGGGCILK